MPKNKKKLTLEEVYPGSDYTIDDSMMPSAEEMKKIPKIPPELKQKALESAREIAREILGKRGEKVNY